MLIKDSALFSVTASLRSATPRGASPLFDAIMGCPRSLHNRVLRRAATRAPDVSVPASSLGRAWSERLATR